MSGKRAYQQDGDDQDSKRIRANDGSPAPASPATAGLSDAEKKKRETLAKMASLKAKVASQNKQSTATAPAIANNGAPGATARANIDQQIAALKAKFAQRQGSSASPVNGAAAPPPSKSVSLQEQIEEAKARAAASKAANATRQAGRTQQQQQQQQASVPSSRDIGEGARGGLGVGLHPSLLGDIGPPQVKGRPGQQGPKFSTTKGNQQPELPKVNPYLAGSEDEIKGDGSFDPALGPRKLADRQSKQLAFNQRGKYMAQANALRQQAKLEEMNRRIAAEARKAEIEEASDKAFLVPVPLDMEWWDDGMFQEGQNSYIDWEAPGHNRIEGSDTIVTALIQRPVLLQAPQDKFAPAPKPLMLTPKEQKKLRRQRRMIDRKEEQAKIRLGIVEPPPPKVKKSNMMRVLGEQAVKDPTAVEARVNREIAQRAADHEQANQERALTKEQRNEKLKNQQAGDEAKGVKIAVFKINNLSSGKHRYQIDVNAKQNSLTGIVVLHPEMNLVIVEGGNHSIAAYKKLMLKRIRWTENTAPLEGSQPTTFTGTTDGSNANPETGLRTSGSKAAAWCTPLDEKGYLKDLSNNQCMLVWEGDQATRSFRRWGSRACETDGEARDVLSRPKMENMWTLARTK